MVFHLVGIKGFLVLESLKKHRNCYNRFIYVKKVII